MSIYSITIIQTNMNYVKQEETHLCYLQSKTKYTKKRTNEELIEEFLSWKKSYRPCAANRYRSWVTRFQVFVNKNPESLVFQDFVAFSDTIRDKYAPKTIQYAHNIIHNYLRFYSEQGRLGFPLYFVRVPRARAESHRVVTEKEVALILKSMVRSTPIGMRDELIVRLLYDTGVRVGELVSINVEDTNETPSVIIETEKTVDERIVFWTDEADRLLRKYLEWRRRQGFKSHALFVGMSKGNGGHRLTARSVERVIKRLCQQSNVNERTCPHSFRHAFIHRMARRGLTDAVVARLVGHRTTHSVIKYTHLSRMETEAFYKHGNSRVGDRWNEHNLSVVNRT